MCQGKVHLAVVSRIGLSQIGTDRAQIGYRLGRSNPWLQMADGLENPSASAFVQIHCFVADYRHEEIRRKGQKSPAEPSRRDTDKGKGTFVQPNRLAHHA